MWSVATILSSSTVQYVWASEMPDKVSSAAKCMSSDYSLLKDRDYMKLNLCNTTSQSSRKK